MALAAAGGREHDGWVHGWFDRFKRWWAQGNLMALITGERGLDEVQVEPRSVAEPGRLTRSLVRRLRSRHRRLGTRTKRPRTPEMMAGKCQEVRHEAE